MARPSSPRLFCARLVGRAAARRAAIASGTTRGPFRRNAAVAAAALTLAAAGPALAQGPTPQGGEVRVNTFTASNQDFPAVARDADGDFVVVWSGAGSGDDHGVFAQRFTRTGAPAGREIHINAVTAFTQARAAVAMDTDGDFVVVWTSDQQDGSGTGVFGQRFAADGARAGAEFQVNTTTFTSQSEATVAMDSDGDFVISWTSRFQDGAGYGVYAQRYAAGGARRGAEFRANATTTGDQYAPSAAMDSDGDFAVAWTSNGQDGSSYGVYAQRYAASGDPAGPEFRVNTTTAGSQFDPWVTTDADGDLVVAWAGNGPGDGSGVFGQRFAADGAPVGPEFRASTYTTNSQYAPAVALDADGDLVVVWQSVGQDGSGYGLYGQRYTPNGSRQGGEFRVHVETGGNQTRPAVAVDADGDVVAAWSSLDGSGYGVYARRFEGPNRPVASGGPLGPEVRVNTTTTGNQNAASVATDAAGSIGIATWQSAPVGRVVVTGQLMDGALRPTGPEFLVHTDTESDGDRVDDRVAMDADGDFVVTWTQRLPGSLSSDVYARRFAASGAPAGPEFRVNAGTSHDCDDADVAMDADGDFVVAWTRTPADGSRATVRARRYSASGSPGEEFLVGTATDSDDDGAAVALDADGDLVVTWTRTGPGGRDVTGRAYAATGIPRGPEFRVNAGTSHDCDDADVAMDADGDFAVSWTRTPADGSATDVRGRRYTAGGAPREEFRLSQLTFLNASRSSVSMDADGDLVATWTETTPDCLFSDVYARTVSAAGVAGPDILLNTYTTCSQRDPSVAMDAAGDYIAAWTSAGQDGDGDGVFARRFDAERTAVELRGAEGWRTLAAPTAAATVGDLLGPVWTQGFPGADAPTGGSNVYRYDEAAPGPLTSGYIAPASAAELMGPGRGYFAYVFEDDDLRPASPGVQGGFPKALRVGGLAPGGPVTITVTYTVSASPSDDGWNLVGNPYQTSVDWDLTERVDVSAVVYVYDPRLPGYRVWNGVAGDLERGVVTAGQGFWVKAADFDGDGVARPAASIPASAQVAGDGQFYGRPGSGGEAPAEASTAPVVALRLTRGTGGPGREAQAFVAFVDGASVGMDAWDAYALAPAAATYASLSTAAPDGTALAIQALPLSPGRYALDLSASATEGGQPAGGPMALSWDAAALPSGWTARLLDTETGASADLTAAGTYAFEAAALSGSANVPAVDLGPPAPTVQRGGSARFAVVVEAQAVGTEDGAEAVLALGVSPNPVSTGGVVRVSLPEAGAVRVVVYDVLGRQVAVLADGERSAGTHDVVLDAGHLAPGVYVVRLTAGEATVVRRVTVAR